MAPSTTSSLSGTLAMCHTRYVLLLLLNYIADKNAEFRLLQNLSKLFWSMYCIIIHMVLLELHAKKLATNLQMVYDYPIIMLVSTQTRAYNAWDNINVELRLLTPNPLYRPRHLCETSTRRVTIESIHHHTLFDPSEIARTTATRRTTD